MAKCHGKTASGQPCKMKALKGGRYCFTHEPTNRAAQAEARKRGGMNSATPHAGDPASIPANIGSLEDAKKIPEYVLAELLAADNSIPRNRALLAVFDSFVKAIEQTEIIKRLEALEARK